MRTPGRAADCGAAFTFAGPVVMVEHAFDGRGPIGITWRLVHALPAELSRRFSILRDA